MQSHIQAVDLLKLYDSSLGIHLSLISVTVSYHQHLLDSRRKHQSRYELTSPLLVNTSGLFPHSWWCLPPFNAYVWSVFINCSESVRIEFTQFFLWLFSWVPIAVMVHSRIYWVSFAQVKFLFCVDGFGVSLGEVNIELESSFSQCSEWVIWWDGKSVCTRK